jgi:hypothetical protein
MNQYEVELVHEPSGAHMSFIMFTETSNDEIALAEEIWADMSVVVLDYKEGDEHVLTFTLRLMRIL